MSRQRFCGSDQPVCLLLFYLIVGEGSFTLYLPGPLGNGRSFAARSPWCAFLAAPRVVVSPPRAPALGAHASLSHGKAKASSGPIRDTAALEVRCLINELIVTVRRVAGHPSSLHATAAGEGSASQAGGGAERSLRAGGDAAIPAPGLWFQQKGRQGTTRSDAASEGGTEQGKRKRFSVRLRTKERAQAAAHTAELLRRRHKGNEISGACLPRGFYVRSDI